MKIKIKEWDELPLNAPNKIKNIAGKVVDMEVKEDSLFKHSIWINSPKNGLFIELKDEWIDKSIVDLNQVAIFMSHAHNLNKKNNYLESDLSLMTKSKREKSEKLAFWIVAFWLYFISSLVYIHNL